MPTENLIPGTDDATGLSAWYALRVRSNHEKTVRRHLDYAGADCYLPVYSEESRWSDRTKTVERILFPGYVFARSENPGSLLRVAGVASILGGFRPSVIPQSQIDSVRIVLASMHPVTATDFTPGERVTITRGAMKGVSGVVQRIGKGFRLVVNVDMLGRGVAVELDVEMLAKQRKAAA